MNRSLKIEHRRLYESAMPEWILYAIVVISAVMLVILCYGFFKDHYSACRGMGDQFSNGADSREHPEGPPLTRHDVIYGDDQGSWYCEVCEHANEVKSAVCLLCGADKGFSFNRESLLSQRVSLTPVEGDRLSLQAAFKARLTERRLNVLTQRQKIARQRRMWVRKAGKNGTWQWFRNMKLRPLRSSMRPSSKSDNSGARHAKDLAKRSSDFELAVVLELRTSTLKERSRLTLIDVDTADASKCVKGFSMSDQDLQTLEVVSTFPFGEKCRWFVQQTGMLLQNGEEGHLRMRIRRDNILRESIEQLLGIQPQHMHLPLRIEFIGESGVDAGGLEREWFTLLAEKIFDERNGLFRPCHLENLSYHINPDSESYTPDHLHYYRGIGRLIGRALLEGQLFKAHLCLPLLKQIIGSPLSLRDLEMFDGDLYKNLRWLRTYCAVEDLHLDFTVTVEKAGKFQIVELKPGGATIPVTANNKEEYVRLRFRHAVLGSIAHQLRSLLDGLFEVIPQEMIMVFDHQELELVLSGVPEIDVEDWKSHTSICSNLEGTDSIRWFWEVVRQFNNEQRARLLQFATGSSRVPPQGFKALTSYDGRICPFSLRGVKISEHEMGFPRAHTCFNRIDIPLFKRKDELENMLKLVINMEVTGFSEE